MKNTEIETLIINYLNGLINEADSKNLLHWLELSENNRDLFLNYYNVWNLSNAPQFDAEKAFNRFAINIQKTESPPVIKKTPSTSFSLLTD